MVFLDVFGDSLWLLCRATWRQKEMAVAETELRVVVTMTGCFSEALLQTRDPASSVAHVCN